jgi:tripartite-type tricarboxylate transporter receptor subunit TctC
MTLMKAHATLAAVVITATTILLPSSAKAEFPEKPISFIVPFGAGGGFDRIARKVAEEMAKALNVAVVIKNIPGAGGRRGSIQLFKSKPDGYTVGFAHYVPFQTDEILRGKKTAVDYRKFAVVYQVSHSRHYIFVRKNLGINSLAELKAANRTIKFSSTGVGAITWVEGGALGASVGIPVSFVTGYKSLPVAALAVAKGDVDAGAGSAHHFKGVIDDIKPIVFLGAKRDTEYPDVPSIAELGYPELTELGSPRVVAAPPGVPNDRMSILREGVKKAISDPGFVKWSEGAGYFLRPQGPEGLKKTLQENAKIYAGLKPLMDEALKKK